MKNTSILAAFETMWQHVVARLGNKADVNHTHDEYAAQTNLDSHVSNANIHVTSDEKTNINTAYTHSQSAHAPSNAERNVVVGIQKNGTDLTVDSSTRKINITVPTTAEEVGASPSNHNHDDKYDMKGSSVEALTEAKTYTDAEVSELSAMVAYIDENDNETVTLSVDLERLSYLIGGDV